MCQVRSFVKQEEFAPKDKTYVGYIHWREDADLDAIRARASRVFALPPDNVVRSTRSSCLSTCRIKRTNQATFVCWNC